MKQFFSRNIDGKGRAIRALLAVGFFIGAGFAFQVSTVAGALLIVAALFTSFEALRGWCVARACGVKTKY